MSHVIAMIQQYGLGFVFLNVLALQAGLPIPAYPTLIVAGAYAASGGNPLWALVLVGIAAALTADTGWYIAGRKFGLRILSTLCRVSLSQDSCVRQTESIFQRFGPASMLFAKFVPGFASVATALAGALRSRNCPTRWPACWAAKTRLWTSHGKPPAAACTPSVVDQTRRRPSKR